MAIPAKDRTPTQKRLAEGLSSIARGQLGGGRRGRRQGPGRSRRARAAQAGDRRRSRRPLPRPPAHARPSSTRSRRLPRRSCSAAARPRIPARRSSPRPPGVLLAAQPAAAFDPDEINPTDSTTGRRLALAKWLTRPDNPLTARVIVNRLWQHHFGRGIVATPSDFGVRGEPPTHPELLDWLATELVAQGWRLKPIHRLMVTSAAYRQSSTAPPEVAGSRPPTIPTTASSGG